MLKKQQLNCQIINHADSIQKRNKKIVTRNYQFTVYKKLKIMTGFTAPRDCTSRYQRYYLKKRSSNLVIVYTLFRGNNRVLQLFQYFWPTEGQTENMIA